ncbi:ArsC family reductase [Psychrosphaera algicola]|uniref:ArsC family reductase n=1 Tax=Psychrosphaera algicola TaxID=3023714 RepID=A0ABT5F8R5_9GAMM|nr:ArsC family reductase [Psychrosphaera sp. G1-22]MDC2887816.1 ArsC family reductase [Psychrosphaera sp. G1-22]
MNTTTIFGIKNCDTIKKAQKWLTTQDISFTFHDYRKDGIEHQWLVNVCKELGWQNVLNKRGTTFRQLDDSTKEAMDESLAIKCMLDAPAMIKRPILYTNGNYYLGFKQTDYETLFGKS